MKKNNTIDDIFQAVRLGEFSLTNKDNIFDSKIEVINSLGQSLLHEAISHMQNEIAEKLISLGYNVNLKDEKGLTPLHYAALHNNLNGAISLLSNGARVNEIDNFGNTPLWTAVFYAKGKYKMVETMLKNGGNPLNKNNTGRSPLDFASQINDEALVNLLVKG